VFLVPAIVQLPARDEQGEQLVVVVIVFFEDQRLGLVIRHIDQVFPDVGFNWEGDGYGGRHVLFVWCLVFGVWC